MRSFLSHLAEVKCRDCMKWIQREECQRSADLQCMECRRTSALHEQALLLAQSDLAGRGGRGRGGRGSRGRALPARAAGGRGATTQIATAPMEVPMRPKAEAGSVKRDRSTPDERTAASIESAVDARKLMMEQAQAQVRARAAAKAQAQAQAHARAQAQVQAQAQTQAQTQTQAQGRAPDTYNVSDIVISRKPSPRFGSEHYPWRGVRISNCSVCCLPHFLDPGPGTRIFSTRRGDPRGYRAEWCPPTLLPLAPPSPHTHWTAELARNRRPQCLPCWPLLAARPTTMAQ